MAKATKDEKDIISKVEDIVSDYFGVELNRIVSKDNSKNVSMARNLIYYILHCKKGISISKIADSFFRTTRSIKMQVANTKFCIEKNNAYKHMFEDVYKLI